MSVIVFFVFIEDQCLRIKIWSQKGTKN